MSEKTAELLERLKAKVATLTTEESWKAYLRVQATFHSYSFRNTILILTQREDATRVAGFHTWKTLGRSVKKGEKGIGILAPMAIKQAPTTDDPEPGTKLRFRLAYVFDVSQTEGDPLADAPITCLSGDDDRALALWAHLAAFAASRGIPVDVTNDLPTGANGCFNRTERTIRVRATNPPLQRTKTLAHELGHALLHGDATDSHERPIMEVEAESVAFVVLQHHGLDSGGYTFGYVAHWAQEKDLASVLLTSGTRIAAAAKSLLDFKATETELDGSSLAEAA